MLPRAQPQEEDTVPYGGAVTFAPNPCYDQVSQDVSDLQEYSSLTYPTKTRAFEAVDLILL